MSGPARRLVALAVAGALSVSAFLAVAILLFGDFGQTEGRILATTTLLGAYSLLALPAAFLLDQGRLRILAVLVLVLAAGGFSVAVTSLWLEDGEEFGKAMGTITVFGLAAAQTAALAARMRPPERASVSRLFALSVALALVAAGLLATAVWAEIESEGYFRVLGALVVLDVLAVLLQPVLALSRPHPDVYRLKLMVDSGEELEQTVEAGDFAAAAAKAIRSAEAGGRSVTAVLR